MPNCERGVGQGRRLPVDGGEIESDQHPIAAGCVETQDCQLWHYDIVVP